MMVQQAMLCGDEMQSAVVDLGSSSCRFGSAGQDMPRHVFRSEIGLIADETGSRSIYGDTGLRYLHKDLHIRTLAHDSPTKWDDVTALLLHGVERCMHLRAQETPLFLSGGPLLLGLGERGKSLSRAAEVCFEGVGAPALYIGSSGMLSCFSAGRTTGLVVDVGSAGTYISPVVDGYELRRAAAYTSRGGDAVDRVLLQALAQEGAGAGAGVGAAGVGAEGFPVPWFDTPTPRDLTSSFRQMHRMDIVRDAKAALCFIPHCAIPPLPLPLSQPPLSAEYLSALSRHRLEELTQRGLIFPPPYELPDGTQVVCDDALCTAPERVFFPTASGREIAIESEGGKEGGVGKEVSRKRARQLLQEIGIGGGGGGGEGLFDPQAPLRGLDLQSQLQRRGTLDREALADLIYACVASADVDSRKELLTHVALVGGGSLLSGLAPRLAHDLGGIAPQHLKVKMAQSLPMERQHAAWIGASVLGICGSFQSEWVTRAEYEEWGAMRTGDRFDH
ncbi:actin family [Ochromonadaceae sp. CCMP2298]|nr:actin family [Ochromonadaceae sp. CCMP2298]